MIELLSTFLVAFAFSFIGTIPPGTLNLTAIQLGLNRKINAAWRLAAAAAMIEYPYAWVAVFFQNYLSRSLEFTRNFHLISAFVMIALGVTTLWFSRRQSGIARRFEDSGFRKGLVLALLNPLAIPFWLAMTAYLRSHGWITLMNPPELHAYLLGISSGTFVLLILVAYLSHRGVGYFKENSAIKKIPGIVLIILGLYSFARYMFE
jgi:threonine/homoserine/homoserine lactone efflux protein